MFASTLVFLDIVGFYVGVVVTTKRQQSSRPKAVSLEDNMHLLIPQPEGLQSDGYAEQIQGFKKKKEKKSYWFA